MRCDAKESCEMRLCETACLLQDPNTTKFDSERGCEREGVGRGSPVRQRSSIVSISRYPFILASSCAGFTLPSELDMASGAVVRVLRGWRGW